MHNPKRQDKFETQKDKRKTKGTKAWNPRNPLQKLGTCITHKLTKNPYELKSSMV